jgi:hypothetical protein
MPRNIPNMITIDNQSQQHVAVSLEGNLSVRYIKHLQKAIEANCRGKINLLIVVQDVTGLELVKSYFLRFGAYWEMAANIDKCAVVADEIYMIEIVQFGKRLMPNTTIKIFNQNDKTSAVQWLKTRNRPIVPSVRTIKLPGLAHVLGLVVIGDIAEEDLKASVTELKTIQERHGKVSLYLAYINTEGLSVPTTWEALRLSDTFLSHFNKVAIVSYKNWVAYTLNRSYADAPNTLMAFFDIDNRTDALAWLSN